MLSHLISQQVLATKGNSKKASSRYMFFFTQALFPLFQITNIHPPSSQTSWVTHSTNASKYITLTSLLGYHKVRSSFSRRYIKLGAIWMAGYRDSSLSPKTSETSAVKLWDEDPSCSQNFHPQYMACGSLAINAASVNFSTFVKGEEPRDTVRCQLPRAPVLKLSGFSRGALNLHSWP